jgi:hypothetical protein
MLSLILQDWISFQGDGGTTNVVVQSEPNWFDASNFQDIVFWTHTAISEPGGGSLTIDFQTSPIKNESSFVTMATVNLPAGVQTTALPLATATVPLARWVRWRFSASPSGTYLTTFRILASVSARGV